MLWQPTMLLAELWAGFVDISAYADVAAMFWAFPHKPIMSFYNVTRFLWWFLEGRFHS